jgi:hypothetical protein
MWKYILTTFFIVSAIFWGFFPHGVLCNVTKFIAPNCIQHTVHLVLSVISFILAITIYHQDYLFNLKIS